MTSHAGAPLTERPAGKALADHHREVRDLHLRDLFAKDPGRAARFTREAVGLYARLLEAPDHGRDAAAAARAGRRVRPARAHRRHVPGREDQRHRGPRRPARGAARAARRAHRRRRRGRRARGARGARPHGARSPTGCAAARGPATPASASATSINIGIGGSDLGPVMAYEALRHYAQRDLTVRFVSNVDGTDFAEATRDLDPAETLFIVSSKTFTTLETMTNAQTARALEPGVAAATRRPSPSTSSPSRPTRRRSRSSASTRPTCSASGTGWAAATPWTRRSACPRCSRSGPTHFRAMLDGFHAMDEHFRTAPFEQNLPVLMGLLAVWYNNFFGAQTVAVLPYEQYLKRFPAYLQQLTMESNGKHVTLDGAPRRLRDRPDLLGRAGHQRTALVLPADPPGHEAHPVRLHRASAQPLNPLPPHHDLLIANVFAQAEALAFGKTADEVRAEGTADWLVPHRTFEGNRPSTVILAERLTPRRSARWSRCTSTASSRRASSGASTRSTSGASSSARCWRSASSPSCKRTASPRSRITTARRKR